jgi:hypothetical protein
MLARSTRAHSKTWAAWTTFHPANNQFLSSCQLAGLSLTLHSLIPLAGYPSYWAGKSGKDMPPKEFQLFLGGENGAKKGQLGSG